MILVKHLTIDRQFPHKALLVILITILAIGVVIRLATDTPGDTSDKPIDDITDIDWSKPPCSPNELSKDWKEITDSRMSQHSNRRIFQYKDTDWRIAHELGESGVSGFKGKNHWHRYNPFSVNDNDLYLDQNGNPTKRKKKPSHILPNCD